MRFLRLILLCSLLLGCRTPSVLQGSGIDAPAPSGFVDYCLRYPQRAECGGTE